MIDHTLLPSSLIEELSSKKQKIFVAMSGGVDSSVCAALLKSLGKEVTGLFMRNWSDSHCSADEDHHDVARICEQLDIPYYALNYEREYAEQVFEEFVADYQRGLTPNPDILCNREIKFKVLFDQAMRLGADYLATGHYAQLLPLASLKKRSSLDLLPASLSGDLEQQSTLAKGLDPNKDQSYFLYQVDPATLPHVLFPLGGLCKETVRSLARSCALVTAEKKDSTGICFIGKRKFRLFLQNYLPAQKGKILNLEGKEVGEHEGVSFYTIGQRKGLAIGGPGEAWFVVAKNPTRNILYASQGEEAKELLSRSCTTLAPYWMVDLEAKLREGGSLKGIGAKIRYRCEEALCRLSLDQEGGLSVVFDEPQRAITPGQSIVFYHEGFCLGGAVIRARSHENLPKGLMKNFSENT